MAAIVVAAAWLVPAGSALAASEPAQAAAQRRLCVTAVASSITPVAGEKVTVRVHALDRSSRPLRGVRVRAAWVLPGRVVRKGKRTSRRGSVAFSRTLGASLAGETLVVRLRARLGDQVRRRILRLAVGEEWSGDRLDPYSLVYRGAFRLPGPSGTSSWGWSGDGLTYYPGGDPAGAADGYPGSLFGIGHDWQHDLSEVSIPAPVVSADKDPAELPRARTLQPFANVRGDLYPDLGEEIRRADVEYLPAQAGQRDAHLYLCWGRHMQLGEANATHMWCGLDLSDPRPAGPWSVAGLDDYVTCDYLFGIDPAWAAASTPGKLLATGRFRDGGQGTMGPSLYAIGPWLGGDPPPAGAELAAVPLLVYDNVWNDGEHVLAGYHHSDEWSGAAWVTAGGRGAVVFAGTKGGGDCWYGFSNGTVWPDEPPYPPVPPDGDRGWWSSSFSGELLFYDPADLAAVAAGSLDPDRPQPYATLPLDDYLFAVRSDQQKRHVGAVAFDRAHGRLFVMEPLADGDDSIVHLWQAR
jgi:hypothetical protein